MRSRISLVAALLLAACGGGGHRLPRATPAGDAIVPRPDHVPLPPEAGEIGGPRGTSGAGAARYDEVGYASWYGEEMGGAATASGERFDPAAITAAHRTLPLGSYAEVTALDSGRTIVVRINDRGPGRADRIIDLSRGAAALLGDGMKPVAAVRVRSTVIGPEEIAALAAGGPAAERLAASPALLAALRKRLPASATVPATAPPRLAVPHTLFRAPDGAPADSGARHYLVQIAAFSSEGRATALARTLAGRVDPAGRLFRVRLGPFADLAAAQRARDDAARRGYGDASIIVQP